MPCKRSVSQRLKKREAERKGVVSNLEYLNEKKSAGPEGKGKVNPSAGGEKPTL